MILREVAIFRKPLKYNIFPVRFVSIIALLLCIPLAACAKSYKAGEIYTPQVHARLYGKYEFRMQAGKGSGLVSAFFLWKDGSETGIPWEEVDIEVFGKSDAKTWQSNIITGTVAARETSEGAHTNAVSLGDDFHTYRLEWKPDSVAWYLDDTLIRESTTSNNDQVNDLVSPSQVRLNFWPPDIPAWAGAFDDDILPVYMYVDWVKYYAWNEGTLAFESSPLWQDDFNSFDTVRWSKADWTFTENLADFIPENAYVEDGKLVLAITSIAGGSSSGSSSSGSGSSSGSSSKNNSGGGGGCPGLIMGMFLYFLSRRVRKER